MYLALALYEAIYADHPDEEKDRYNSLQADLEVFVTGLPITDSYLSPLRPPNSKVWEIRSKVPKPSVRLFGLFVGRDVFVGTSYQARRELKSSIDWKLAIRTAHYEWRELFYPYEPAHGQLHELATRVIYVRRQH